MGSVGSRSLKDRHVGHLGIVGRKSRREGGLLDVSSALMRHWKLNLRYLDHYGAKPPCALSLCASPINLTEAIAEGVIRWGN